MDMILFIVFGVVLVPMIIMAIFLLRGKGASLIAGYNTMSKAEKSKYDEKAMCRSVGKLLLGLSFCMLLVPIGVQFDLSWLVYCGIAITIVGSVGFAIYANTGNRFRKEPISKIATDSNDVSKPKPAKGAIIAAIVISVIVLAAVGVLFFQGDKDPAIQVFDEHIVIEGMYGLRVDFADVSDISLIEQSMSNIGTGRRTNGYGGFGDALKGNFRSDTLGEILLFVQSNSSPTIRIERDGQKDVYISFRDGAATKALYAEMIEALSS